MTADPQAEVLDVGSIYDMSTHIFYRFQSKSKRITALLQCGLLNSLSSMAPANHSSVLLYFHFSLLDTFLVKVVQNQVDRLKLGEEMFYKELFYIS